MIALDRQKTTVFISYAHADEDKVAGVIDALLRYDIASVLLHDKLITNQDYWYREILIRFIRSNRVLDIFGEKFKVSKELVYSYVKAVIVTKIHRLQLYLGDELIDAFDYRLPTKPWH
jgi:hypothetical protein